MCLGQAGIAHTIKIGGLAGRVLGHRGGMHTTLHRAYHRLQGDGLGGSYVGHTVIVKEPRLAVCR